MTTQRLLDPLFLRKLEMLKLSSRRSFSAQMKGEKRSAKRGSSVEFADYREYTHGDDLRYVDWKAYGRLEKLFVKLFVEEEELNLHLLVDTSRSMDFGLPVTKFDYSRQLAAALGYIALSHYDRVSAGGFSSNLTAVMPSVRGKAGIGSLFRFLETSVRIGETTEFGRALGQYAARVKQSGVLVIFSDFFDPGYVEGVKALLRRGFQIVLLQVLDAEERDPTAAGDLQLRDSETGEQCDVSISPQLLQEYQERLTAFRKSLQEFATRYGMDYFCIPTDTPLEQVILHDLRRAGIVR